MLERNYLITRAFIELFLKLQKSVGNKKKMQNYLAFAWYPVVCKLYHLITAGLCTISFLILVLFIWSVSTD